MELIAKPWKIVGPDPALRDFAQVKTAFTSPRQPILSTVLWLAAAITQRSERMIISILQKNGLDEESNAFQVWPKPERLTSFKF